VRLENLHYQPQQSVLKPHSGQRQTACIRYISALPQRSQIILSVSGGLTFGGTIGRTGGGVSDMAGIIALTPVYLPRAARAEGVTTRI
jgi:hypothetical protein